METYFITFDIDYRFDSAGLSNDSWSAMASMCCGTTIPGLPPHLVVCGFEADGSLSIA